MGPLEKIKRIAHVLHWRFTWSKRKLGYRPGGIISPKFITAREAEALISDGACVVSSGIAGNARCSASAKEALRLGKEYPLAPASMVSGKGFCMTTDTEWP